MQLLRLMKSLIVVLRSAQGVLARKKGVGSSLRTFLWQWLPLSSAKKKGKPFFLTVSPSSIG